MAAMDIVDAHVVLNEVVSQATGKKVTTAPVDANTFISVARQGLEVGLDKVANALSLVLARTLIAIRPYQGRFSALARSDVEWGAHTRKLNYAWDDAETNQDYPLEENGTVDQYKIKKAKVLQTNYYGSDNWQDHITIYDKQLRKAFTGPDEFARYIEGIFTMMNNKRTVQDEAMQRLALNNFIAGILSTDVAGYATTQRVYPLVTMYKTERNQPDMPVEDVKKPENWKNFVQFAFSKISEVSQRMKDETYLYHSDLNGVKIPRHTDTADQMMFLSMGFKVPAEYQALADTYHDNYLKLPDNNPVTFWQNAALPNQINVKPVLLKANGSVGQPGSAVKKDNVIGCLIDRDAVGVNVFDDSMATSPHNAAGEYHNIFWHNEYRYYNDFTENGCVFLLE